MSLSLWPARPTSRRSSPATSCATPSAPPWSAPVMTWSWSPSSWATAGWRPPAVTRVLAGSTASAPSTACPPIADRQPGRLRLPPPVFHGLADYRVLQILDPGPIRDRDSEAHVALPIPQADDRGEHAVGSVPHMGDQLVPGL